MVASFCGWETCILQVASCVGTSGAHMAGQPLDSCSLGLGWRRRQFSARDYTPNPDSLQFQCSVHGTFSPKLRHFPQARPSNATSSTAEPEERQGHRLSGCPGSLEA
jgi:hypothetical protein